MRISDADIKKLQQISNKWAYLEGAQSAVSTKRDAISKKQIELYEEFEKVQVAHAGSPKQIAAKQLAKERYDIATDELNKASAKLSTVRAETLKAKQEYDEARFEIQFKGSDEAYHESVALFAKIGAAAAFPMLAWSLYSPERTFEVAAYALASYLASIAFLFVGLFVAWNVSRQMAKFEPTRDSFSWRYRKQIDFVKGSLVWLQWTCISIGVVKVLQASFEWN
jgi:hypothetical protein